MYGEIITNGTLINDNAARTFVDISWDRLTFSIEAPDEETDDFFSGVSLHPFTLVQETLHETYNKYGLEKIPLFKYSAFCLG